VYRAVVLTTFVALLLAAVGVAVAGSNGDDSSVLTTPEGTSLGSTVPPNPDTTAPGGASSSYEEAEDTSEPTLNTQPTVAETEKPAAAEPVEETPAPDSEVSKESGRPEHTGKPPESGEPEERRNEGGRGSGAGQQKVTLCHRGKDTITVGEPAKEAHLRHGDTVGPCQTEGAPPEPFEEDPGPGGAQDDGGGGGNGQEKVTLCHKGETLTVGEPAKEAHLRHGDSLGPC
jgi:hypothetical protein